MIAGLSATRDDLEPGKAFVGYIDTPHQGDGLALFQTADLAIVPPAESHLRSVLEMSERRACTIVVADRKMIRYCLRRPPDTELRARLRELANQRRRFGYRRLFILLRREGEPSGINRIYRLYREEGLTVRKRRARRRAVGTRIPILVEARVNARWSLASFITSLLLAGASVSSTSSMM